MTQCVTYLTSFEEEPLPGWEVLVQLVGHFLHIQPPYASQSPFKACSRSVKEDTLYPNPHKKELVGDGVLEGGIANSPHRLVVQSIAEPESSKKRHITPVRSDGMF